MSNTEEMKPLVIPMEYAPEEESDQEDLSLSIKVEPEWNGEDQQPSSPFRHCEHGSSIGSPASIHGQQVVPSIKSEPRDPLPMEAYTSPLQYAAPGFSSMMNPSLFMSQHHSAASQPVPVGAECVFPGSQPNTDPSLLQPNLTATKSHGTPTEVVNTIEEVKPFVFASSQPVPGGATTQGIQPNPEASLLQPDPASTNDVNTATSVVESFPETKPNSFAPYQPTPGGVELHSTTQLTQSASSSKPPLPPITNRNLCLTITVNISNDNNGSNCAIETKPLATMGNIKLELPNGRNHTVDIANAFASALAKPADSSEQHPVTEQDKMEEGRLDLSLSCAAANEDDSESEMGSNFLIVEPAEANDHPISEPLKKTEKLHKSACADLTKTTRQDGPSHPKEAFPKRNDGKDKKSRDHLETEQQQPICRLCDRKTEKDGSIKCTTCQGRVHFKCSGIKSIANFDKKRFSCKICASKKKPTVDGEHQNRKANATSSKDTNKEKLPGNHLEKQPTDSSRATSKKEPSRVGHKDQNKKEPSSKDTSQQKPTDIPTNKTKSGASKESESTKHKNKRSEVNVESTSKHSSRPDEQSTASTKTQGKSTQSSISQTAKTDKVSSSPQRPTASAPESAPTKAKKNPTQPPSSSAIQKKPNQPLSPTKSQSQEMKSTNENTSKTAPKSKNRKESPPPKKDPPPPTPRKKEITAVQERTSSKQSIEKTETSRGQKRKCPEEAVNQRANDNGLPPSLAPPSFRIPKKPKITEAETPQTSPTKGNRPTPPVSEQPAAPRSVTKPKDKVVVPPASKPAAPQPRKVPVHQQPFSLLDDITMSMDKLHQEKPSPNEALLDILKQNREKILKQQEAERLKRKPIRQRRPEPQPDKYGWTKTTLIPPPKMTTIERPNIEFPVPYPNVTSYADVHARDLLSKNEEKRTDPTEMEEPPEEPATSVPAKVIPMDKAEPMQDPRIKGSLSSQIRLLASMQQAKRTIAAQERLKPRTTLKPSRLMDLDLSPIPQFSRMNLNRDEEHEHCPSSVEAEQEGRQQDDNELDALISRLADADIDKLSREELEQKINRIAVLQQRLSARLHQETVQMEGLEASSEDEPDAPVEHDGNDVNVTPEEPPTKMSSEVQESIEPPREADSIDEILAPSSIPSEDETEEVTENSSIGQHEEHAQESPLPDRFGHQQSPQIVSLPTRSIMDRVTFPHSGQNVEIQRGVRGNSTGPQKTISETEVAVPVTIYAHHITNSRRSTRSPSRSIGTPPRPSEADSRIESVKENSTRTKGSFSTHRPRTPSFSDVSEDPQSVVSEDWDASDVSEDASSDDEVIDIRSDSQISASECDVSEVSSDGEEIEEEHQPEQEKPGSSRKRARRTGLSEARICQLRLAAYKRWKTLKPHVDPKNWFARRRFTDLLDLLVDMIDVEYEGKKVLDMDEEETKSWINLIVYIASMRDPVRPAKYPKADGDRVPVRRALLPTPATEQRSNWIGIPLAEALMFEIMILRKDRERLSNSRSNERRERSDRKQGSSRRPNRR